MKKLFAIVIAAMMVMALSVGVFADTIYTHEFTDAHDDGWWEDTGTNGLGNDADLVAALKTEGAKLVIYTSADAAPTDNGGGFQYGFQDTSSWANILVHSNFANGEGNLGYESAEVVDGQLVITVDGAAFIAAAEAAGSDLASYNWINGASAGDTTKIEVVVGDAAAPAAEGEAAAPAAEGEAAAPAEGEAAAPAAEAEAPAAEAEAPAAEAPAADAPAAPNTGIALAVVPAVMALAAVAVSKKH